MADYTAFGDSCLHGAGGYSSELNFWWHIRWPTKVRSSNPIDDLLPEIDDSHINTLEYATIIINFIIAKTIINRTPVISRHPHPTILLFSDNKSAISWSIKAANSTSSKAKSLSRLFASHLIRSPLGIHLNHVRGEDNGIADRISRFSNDSPILSQFYDLTQEFPDLRGCQHFQLPPELLSDLSTMLSTSCEPPDLSAKIRSRLQDESTISSSSSPRST
jgi:hypothetical protein